MFYGAYPFGLLFPVPTGALFLSVFSKEQSFRYDYIDSGNSPAGRSMLLDHCRKETVVQQTKGITCTLMKSRSYRIIPK